MSVTQPTEPTTAADERELERCCWCRHPDHGDKVCPVPHFMIGECGLSGLYPCGCTHSTVITRAALGDNQ